MALSGAHAGKSHLPGKLRIESNHPLPPFMTSRQSLKSWKSYFQSKGVRKKVSQDYLKQVEAQLAKGIPIILSFDHLAALMGRTLSYMASVVNSSKMHYRSFKLKKRSGGYREICVPYPALLECQYWILKNILNKRRIHYRAHGFTKSKSIITNAEVHLSSNEILKVDIKDFFPSVRINKLIYLFKSFGYPNDIAFYLSAICTINNHLPQGAPTSPILSNLAFRNTDFRLNRLSSYFGLQYTRYADDLVFSGDSVPYKLLEYIKNIIEDSGYCLNENKTILYKSQGKRVITGLSVAGSTLRVPKSYKRELRQELYYVSKFGIVSHIRKKKIKNPFYAHTLLGKINFILSIEPDNTFFKDKKNEIEKLIE